jgi:hypothetical protein
MTDGTFAGTGPLTDVATSSEWNDMKKAHATFGVGMLALTLAGCAVPGTEPSVASASSSKVTLVDGLLVGPEPRPTPGISEGSNLARHGGELALEDGCVFVGGVPTVFPHDVRWDGQILTMAGDTYTLGDEIMLGGGYMHDPGRLAEIPEACTADEVFFASTVLRLD